MKTSEKTTTNPGMTFFKQNRKTMRKRAEQKFQEEVISRIEAEREKFELKSEQEVQMLQEEVRTVNRYMTHRVYFNH